MKRKKEQNKYKKKKKTQSDIERNSNKGFMKQNF